MAAVRYMSKAEASKVLRRFGFAEDRISDLLDEVDDPVDLERDSTILLKYGVTRDRLNDMAGGSP